MRHGVQWKRVQTNTQICKCTEAMLFPGPPDELIYIWRTRPVTFSPRRDNILLVLKWRGWFLVDYCGEAETQTLCVWFSWAQLNKLSFSQFWNCVPPPCSFPSQCRRAAQWVVLRSRDPCYWGICLRVLFFCILIQWPLGLYWLSSPLCDGDAFPYYLKVVCSCKGKLDMQHIPLRKKKQVRNSSTTFYWNYSR